MYIYLMIDIDLGRGRILTLDPKRIIGVKDNQLTSGCTIIIEGMDDLHLSCSRIEFIKKHLK